MSITRKGARFLGPTTLAPGMGATIHPATSGMITAMQTAFDLGFQLRLYLLLHYLTQYFLHTRKK
jgi:hypothetical protein